MRALWELRMQYLVAIDLAAIAIVVAQDLWLWVFGVSIANAIAA